MLQYSKVKNHAGLMIVGDYETLRVLHEVIHKVVSTSAMFREEKHGDFLLGLAYEVRKAFELQREILEPPPHYKETGSRYGVKMLWPVLPVQVRVLRAAMSARLSFSTIMRGKDIYKNSRKRMAIVYLTNANRLARFPTSKETFECPFSLAPIFMKNPRLTPMSKPRFGRKV